MQSKTEVGSMVVPKCIRCGKRNRTTYLFCSPCSQKNVFIKINAFRNSKEYKYGFLSDTTYGRAREIKKEEEND